MPTADGQFLLDTHTFLFMAMSPERLGAEARRCIENPQSALLLSFSSIWEIAIKVSLRKLDLQGSVASFLDEQLAATRTTLLPIELRHATRVEALPWHHRDPFDRLLVAQALCEQLPLLSRDPLLDSYGVVRVW